MEATLEQMTASHPMALLAAGVPLSLLIDLLDLDLASSNAIAKTERASVDWVHHAA